MRDPARGEVPGVAALHPGYVLNRSRCPLRLWCRRARSN